MTHSKFRVRIIDRSNNITYLTVYDGKIVLQTATGTPLALSNIADKNTMPLVFALEDAESIDAVVQAVRARVPFATVEAY